MNHPRISQALRGLFEQPTDLARFAYLTTVLADAYEQVETLTRQLQGPKVSDFMPKAAGGKTYAELKHYADQISNTAKQRHRTIEELHNKIANNATAVHTEIARLREVNRRLIDDNAALKAGAAEMQKAHIIGVAPVQDQLARALECIRTVVKANVELLAITDDHQKKTVFVRSLEQLRFKHKLPHLEISDCDWSKV